MSATVEQAAQANAHLSSSSGETLMKPADGYGTMKAGFYDPESKKVVVKDKPVPNPGPNQFLIKLSSASLCHSDIMAIEAGQTATLGHEGAGYIENMHPSVENKGYKKGDKVGFLYINGCCFECEGCMIHNLHCQTGKQLLLGFTTDGFFAEYAVVDEPNCMHLPEAMRVDRAAPIFCAGVTAFHAVDSSELKEGDWLAVVGAGGLGQVATQIGKAKGCKVVAIDINDATLDVCKQQGADAVFNSRTDKNFAEELKKVTNGGAKAACVFSNAQAAYACVPSILRLGGVMMVIGLPHDPVPISTMDLALGKYKVKSESTSIPQRMKKAVDFLAEHNIMPEVELRKLNELNDMVEAMKSGKATKRMLVTF